MVIAGKKSPRIRQLAIRLTEGIPQKDNIAEIRALLIFVRDRIRYVRDINNVETIHTAERILDNKAGDCDDKSILLASLLESIGFKTRFSALSFTPPIKNIFGTFVARNFSHVLPEVLLKNKWIPLETTEPVEMGWYPKNVKSKLIIYNNKSSSNFDGLAGKRVDAMMAKMASDLEKARVIAESENATEEDIEKALKLEKEYAAAVTSYEAGARKKAKGIIPQLIKAQERKIKFLAKLKLPTFGTHVKHAERKRRAQAIKLEVMRLQGQPKSPERDKKLADLSAEIQVIAKKEKQYMKQGVIVATILSIVIGIFTFGGGSAAIQGAFQAIKQGAINIAKGILVAAIKSAISKGASKKDTDKALEVANDLEKYPPDPKLTSLDAMIADSQRKKLEATNKSGNLLIPAAIGAALLLLS